MGEAVPSEIVREPQCHLCGEKRRLKLVDIDLYVCSWEQGCKHRQQQADARIQRDLKAMEGIDMLHHEHTEECFRNYHRLLGPLMFGTPWHNEWGTDWAERHGYMSLEEFKESFEMDFPKDPPDLTSED